MIITRGYGANFSIVTQGYAGTTQKIIRVPSPLHRKLGYASSIVQTISEESSPNRALFLSSSLNA